MNGGVEKSICGGVLDSGTGDVLRAGDDVDLGKNDVLCDVDLGMNDVLCGVDVGLGGICLVVNLVVLGGA